MNRKDFAACLAYVETACKTPLSDKEAEVYWDLLRDLPLDVLRIACKRVVLEHPYKSFPSIAQLRQAASETILGQVAELAPAEAWRLASQAMSKIDPEISGPYSLNGKEYPSQTVAILASLPLLVRKTVSAYGIRSWTHGREQVGVVRAQFLKMFEQNVAHHKRLALMPDALKREIEAKSQAQTPSVAHASLAQIGLEPTTEKFHG
jgi:hypothetical protein